MAKRVLPQEAAELLGQGWVYIDVRSIPEFEASHPAGAANIPLLHAQAGRRFPNPEFQKVVEAHFPKDSKLVIGCQSGGRSAQAAALLEAAGYTQIVDVRGGMGGERDMFGKVAVLGWVAAGLPVEQTAGPGKSYAELSKP
jgi:rhodanese-related sulfurtransferase